MGRLFEFGVKALLLINFSNRPLICLKLFRLKYDGSLLNFFRASTW